MCIVYMSECLYGMCVYSMCVHIYVYVCVCCVHALCMCGVFKCSIYVCVFCVHVRSMCAVCMCVLCVCCVYVCVCRVHVSYVCVVCMRVSPVASQTAAVQLGGARMICGWPVAGCKLSQVWVALICLVLLMPVFDSTYVCQEPPGNVPCAVMAPGWA